MANNDLASIGDIYGGMLSKFKYDNKLTNESHKQNAFDSALDLVGDGPNVDGVECGIEDEYEQGNALADHHPDDCTCKVVATKKTPVSKEYHDEEDEEDFFGEENQKSDKKYLNKHMSKSKFDSIVKKVLRENFGQDDTELDALGLDDATPDDEFDFEAEGEDDGGDEVTITIPKDVAQQLVDLLQGALGGGEEDFGDEDMGDEDLDLDLDMEDEGVEDEDEMGFDYDEDEEGQAGRGAGFIGKDHSKPAGPKKDSDKHKKFQAKGNKVGGKVTAKKGKADPKATDDTGNEYTAPQFGKLQGKDNKVPGNVKPGDFFK